jgi:hypothetical protein
MILISLNARTFHQLLWYLGNYQLWLLKIVWYLAFYRGQKVLRFITYWCREHFLPPTKKMAHSNTYTSIVLSVSNPVYTDTGISGLQIPIPIPAKICQYLLVLRTCKKVTFDQTYFLLIKNWAIFPPLPARALVCSLRTCHCSLYACSATAELSLN